MTQPTGLDADGKLRVRDAFIAHAESALAALTSQSTAERDAARQDRDAVPEAGDSSQTLEAGDLEGLFQRSAAHSRESLDAIRALDFTPTTEVGPGAVVGFDGDHYVVGVSSDAFDCDGVSYEGIGAGSPVYAAIVGKRVGDTFSFRGQDHRLDLVT
ncbi:hypothetical protein [Intrasporangium flavum]|uniref:hypothetical protein n=1 Tax=Intrasporangium flavum TaxID=1428657 RepID=UPI00096E1BF4|nr:hypothetical protein [Intrasporangium flavum]